MKDRDPSKEQNNDQTHIPNLTPRCSRTVDNFTDSRARAQITPNNRCTDAVFARDHTR
jgi:hypothetical protein